MSEKKYSNQPRKPQSFGETVEKYGNTAINTLSAMAIGAGAYGLNLARTARSKAEKAAKARFDNFVADLDKKRVKESLKKKGFKFSGGGGGGTYNVAQPIADKNLMNKFGKKLK